MMTAPPKLPVILLLLFPVLVVSFVVFPYPHNCHEAKIHPWEPFLSSPSATTTTTTTRLAASSEEEKASILINARLDDDKIASLFAWVSRAFAGEPQYNNLMLAMAAIFGNLPEDSDPVEMVQQALQTLPAEEQPVGDALSVEEREYNSLGAMGAAQWTGQFRTRPHALLELHNLTTVEDWVKSLPRGCRRTLKKAVAMEDDGHLTVTSKPIRGGEPAPHSSLAHFRCVVAHEVRLLSQRYGDDAFLDALSEAISRYVGTTRMTGEIREYRNATSGKIIGIAHEVTKGRTIRGQWFYCNDEAAKAYVWFHSVYDLVKRAIATDGVDCVDLGPSGSDDFSELKARYGFRSVSDWPSVADYSGDFWYCGKPRRGSAVDAPKRFWW